MYFIDNIELNKSTYEIEFLIECDQDLSIILKSKEKELRIHLVQVLYWNY